MAATLGVEMVQGPRNRSRIERVVAIFHNSSEVRKKALIKISYWHHIKCPVDADIHLQREAAIWQTKRRRCVGHSWLASTDRLRLLNLEGVFRCLLCSQAAKEKPANNYRWLYSQRCVRFNQDRAELTPACQPSAFLCDLFLLLFRIKSGGRQGGFWHHSYLRFAAANTRN